MCDVDTGNKSFTNASSPCFKWPLDHAWATSNRSEPSAEGLPGSQKNYPRSLQRQMHRNLPLSAHQAGWTRWKPRFRKRPSRPCGPKVDRFRRGIFISITRERGSSKARMWTVPKAKHGNRTSEDTDREIQRQKICLRTERGIEANKHKKQHRQRRLVLRGSRRCLAVVALECS